MNIVHYTKIKSRLFSFSVFILALISLSCRANNQNPMPITAPVKPHAKVVGTLRKSSETPEFFLDVKNVSSKPVWTLLWPMLYEVRVFDDKDNQLSNLRALLGIYKVGGPSKEDWVLLNPNQTATITLYAYTDKGPMRIPSNAVRADCILRSTELEAINKPSDKNEVIFINEIEPISLR